MGGTALARGYLGRAGLTADRFLPSPFARGERLYRTGDLARRRADGNLEFLGRIDHQVKIRGYRVELGEIEVALLSHAHIDQAVAVLAEFAPGDKRLAAYVVAAQGQIAPAARELRAHLKLTLPDYMIPAAFMVLDGLPLTPSGKIDRSALPALETRPEAAYVAPRTPLEESLAAIWTEVLQQSPIGIEDDFFALGGHSLLATRAIARIRDLFEIELSLQAFFEQPTIAGIAARIVSDTIGDIDASTLQKALEEIASHQAAAPGEALPT